MNIIDERMYSERDYLAPTVFKKSGIALTSSWNYYSTVREAIAKYWFLNKRGSVNPAPAGSVSFTGTAAETMGINVDFYIYSGGIWQMSSYKYLRSLSSYPPIIFKFYTRDGNGPYFAIFDSKFFAMAATAINSVSGEKLAALDSFHREVQLLKFRYNSLAAFLNTLAKRQLTPKEQQIFNEGSLKLQSMQGQLQTIRGTEITFTATGAVAGVGVVPLLLIAAIAIVAAATAWTVTEIISEKEKTKRINDTYELNKWVAQKKQEVAAGVQAGTISATDAAGINKTLDSAAATANTVAQNSSTDTSIFGQATKFIQWGLAGYLAYTFIKPSKRTYAR